MGELLEFLSLHAMINLSHCLIDKVQQKPSTFKGNQGKGPFSILLSTFLCKILFLSVLNL